MPDLISKPDFIKATQLKRLGLSALAGPLMKITRLERVNELYDQLEGYEGLAFIDKLLETLGVSVEVDEDELARIPLNTSFITVSNHPFGGLDGMILIKIISARRPDFKVMANFLLQQVEPIKDYILPVNPFENQTRSSLSGMKRSLAHLQEGHPLGIFPAGEVSTFQADSRKITDRPWQRTALKLIQKAEVPVVPVYFQGANSLLFHLMGMVHPSLRTAALPAEMLRRKRDSFRVRIGQPIPAKDIVAFDDVERMGRYLRARTYALGSSLKVKQFFQPRFAQLFEKEQPIADPQPRELLNREIEALREQGAVLAAQQNYEIFLAEAEDIPAILRELGRLRETTYRSVGEGTLKSEDIDEYDLYYRHLILWDKALQEIAGAYRLGLGDEIMSVHGKKGFYTHSLFAMKNKMAPILMRSLELGRSFVTNEHQRKRLPLFLLWKGITVFLERNPQYRYIIGPVSISNSYSKQSKQLMVSFIKKHYFDERLAAFVRPRRKFREKMPDKNLKTLLEEMSNDLGKMDHVMADLEPSHFKLPVLLKKYIHQNARILAFNVDPKFNNSLDGLMILDLKELPEATMDNMKR